MHTQRILLLFALLICTMVTHAQQLTSGSYQAMVIVPVADLVGQPFGHQHNERFYQQMPMCGKTGAFACPRLNQLLFHEIVTVMDQQHDEVQVSIPHMFFQTANSSQPHDTYWTLKKNIIPINALIKQGVNPRLIPEPISYTKRSIIPKRQTIATLLYGHYDPVTRLHFSAGTRFVVDTAHRQPRTGVIVRVYCPRTHSLKRTTFPLSHVAMLSPTASPKEQRALMIKTARRWAHTSKGFIPYVWGGCSFTTPCTEPTFSEAHGRDVFSNKPVTYYTRPVYCTGPINGFDCTGLVVRAAQAAGIPYFYKNTTTLNKNLRPVTSYAQLKPGDLIWIPGHVIIVADLQRNTIIEAAGYPSGYGKVQEIPLSTFFKGIKTYHDLIDAYNSHKPLQRLNNKGGVMCTIKNFNILSLDALWA